MNIDRIKRKLSVDETSNEENKKLSKISNEKRTIYCLENLPIEIFYEIFDYLEGCDLYNAFSNLNTRFQYLLTCSSIRLKIKLNSKSETTLQNQYKHIIASNEHQIFALSLRKSWWLDDFDFTLFHIDSSFTRLESLEFDNIELNKLLPILIGLISLPRLYSLNIDCEYDIEIIGNIYQTIFHLPMLRDNRLTFIEVESFIPLPISSHMQYSGIKYLNINHRCYLDELTSILSYTPQLCRLTCGLLDSLNQNLRKELLYPILTLTYISIAVCHTDLNELEMFITNVSPQLHLLRITDSTDVSFLNADQWERLISQHLPLLRTFEFSYRELIDDDLEATVYHERISRFNSSFWLKRKWFYRLYIDTYDDMDDVLVHSIYSYRKTRAEGNRINANAILDELVAPSPILSATNQITVVDLSNLDYEEPLSNIIGPILLMVPITCLNITYRGIFIGILIDLIACLPNLESLIVSSLTMTEPRCLTIEETRTLHSLSTTNKITKMKLEQTIDLASVQFLLNLCSRVEYFEMNCVNEVLYETLVRFILMKNIKYIPNLSLLCLEISSSKENITKKLRQMIDFEQLCHNYTIKQIDNKFYLRWTR